VILAMKPQKLIKKISYFLNNKYCSDLAGLRFPTSPIQSAGIFPFKDATSFMLLSSEPSFSLVTMISSVTV